MLDRPSLFLDQRRKEEFFGPRRGKGFEKGSGWAVSLRSRGPCRCGESPKIMLGFQQHRGSGVAERDPVGGNSGWWDPFWGPTKLETLTQGHLAEGLSHLHVDPCLAVTNRMEDPPPGPS